MKNTYPYLRKIEPNELADFLNAKGSNANAFKCPVCGGEHQTLVDNMPIDDSKTGETHIVLQSVMPAFLYPGSETIKKEIANGSLPQNYQNLIGLNTSVVNQLMYREVIHLICDNCGHIRSFSKDKIMQWIIQEGKYNAK